MSLLFVSSWMACVTPEEPGPTIDSVSAVPGEIVAPAVRVSVTTSVPTRARVEFGADTTYGRSTPVSEEATEHELTLLGVPAGSTVHYRVVASTADGELIVGDDKVLDLDAAPSALPELTLMQDSDGAWGPWTLATFDRVSDDPAGGVFIADDAANIVWYYFVEEALVYAAEPTAEGDAILILVESDDRSSQIVEVALDGSGVETIPVTNAHHALIPSPREGVRLAYLAWVQEEWEGQQVVGDRIVEVLDDGTEVEVWNAFDHLAVEPRDDWFNGVYLDAADWTHANGICYDPITDSYLVSLYHRERIISLDRATGETRWLLGGDLVDDFEMVGGDAFARQHGPELHGDSLYLFDNGIGGQPSRAVEYSLDVENHSALNVWEWSTPEESRVGVMGDVDLLPSGQVAIAWGDLGQLSVVNRDGSAAERIDVEVAVITPTITKLRTLYP